MSIAARTLDALKEAGCEIEDARIAVLGYAYLENSDDVRNSPSITLISRLEELGAEVVIHDPYVSEYRGDLSAVLRGCDAAMLMVKHNGYQHIDLAQLKSWLARPVLVDGRHTFDRKDALAAGFVFRGVGQGG